MMGVLTLFSVGLTAGEEYRSMPYTEVEARRIVMKDYIVNEEDGDSATNLLRILSREIDHTPPSEVQVFSVSVEDTILHKLYIDSIKQPDDLRKRVLFLEDEHDSLDKYIYVHHPGSQPRMERRKSSVARQFRSLSTNGNEVCLFPIDSDLELCKYIANILAQIRDDT